MKAIHLFFIVCMFCKFKVSAQSLPASCKIKYQYDAGGNRIKREYECETPWNPNDPPIWTDNTIFSNVFPNPTSGVITGVFSEPIGGDAGLAHVVVSTMGGVQIFEQEYTQPTSSINIDITQQLPGDYILTVSAFNRVESYFITKM